MNGDDATIIITQDVITGFIIYYDFTSDVQEAETSSTLAFSGITPNPVENETKVSYTLPTVGQTTVEVFDALGNSVTTLFNGIGNQGMNTVNWNVQNDNVANGVYTIKVTHNGVSIINTLVVVR